MVFSDTESRNSKHLIIPEAILIILGSSSERAIQTSIGARGLKAIKHPGIVTLDADLNTWNVDKKYRVEDPAPKLINPSLPSPQRIIDFVQPPKEHPGKDLIDSIEASL